MSNIFDDQMKEALENAQRLKLIGEPELARIMSIKCVEKAAQYNNEDLICLFYGNGAYEEIKDAADAARYVFIAKCAVNVYDMLVRVSPASSSGSPWAIQDASNSNRQLWDFFAWLQLRHRRVEQTDFEHFRRLLNVLSAAERPHFKMSDRIAQLELLNIIKGLVSGSITLTNNGELR